MYNQILEMGGFRHTHIDIFFSSNSRDRIRRKETDCGELRNRKEKRITRESSKRRRINGGYPLHLHRTDWMMVGLTNVNEGSCLVRFQYMILDKKKLC